MRHFPIRFPPKFIKRFSFFEGGTFPAPAAPTGLTATPVSTSQINLAWTDNATTETAYRVYRSTDGVSYSQVGSDLAADANSYNDATITAGTYYYYKVAAVNAGGETLSAVAGATTLTYLLRSYWKLEEASGTRVDVLGNNNLAESAASLGSGTGKIGNGVSGDGTHYLVKSSGVSDNLQTNGMTFWGWIYVINATGRKGPFQLGNAGADAVFSFESLSQLNFTVYDTVSGGSLADKSGLSLSLDTWYFVWGRYDPSTKKAEVGYDAVAGTVSGTALTNGARTTTRVEIARAYATVTNNAIIDEVGYALRKYTDAEIAALRNGGAGNQYPFAP